MNTIFKRAAIAAIAGLAPAVVAVAQVNVSPNTAGGTNVQAGPATVETGPGGANVNVAPGTGGPVLNNAPARQENRIERRQNRQANRATGNDWRMVNFQNRWWYYHPNNSWSYYDNGRWNAYRVPAPATATQPMPTRRYSAYRAEADQLTGGETGIDGTAANEQAVDGPNLPDTNVPHSAVPGPGNTSSGGTAP
jgi:hypothetical protein